MRKNLIVAIIILIVVCGGISVVTLFMGNTVRAIIEGAVTATARAQNFEAGTTVYILQRNGKDGDVVSVTEENSLIYFSFPYKVKLEANITTVSEGESEGYSMNIARYSVVDNNEIVIYTLSTDKEWSVLRFPMSFQPTFKKVYRENSIIEDIDFYLKSADNFEKDGEEKIKEYNTVKLTGSITGGKIEETVMRFITDDAGVISGLSKEINGIEITVWVDKKSYHIVKYAVDFTEIYNLLYKKTSDKNENPDAAEIAIDKFVSETFIFNFNRAADFEIPQEALNMRNAN